LILEEQDDDSVTIYDPVFTPGDASYLRDYAGYVVPKVRSFSLSLSLISTLFQAELSKAYDRYATDGYTVAYMPHCDLSLFERFLRDNWCPERITNMFIVGNNLCDYADK
jgi:hypothetical protein